MSENGQTCPAAWGIPGGEMKLDPDGCYRALLARDARFDGLFFTGVSTTGIYCRPVCRARTPGRDRCRFYGSAAEAERAGFRACFRCRPEVAPGAGHDDAVPRLVADAVRLVERGWLNERSVDALAKRLDVSSRHLRRAMEATIGVTPVELAQTRRLALAKQLLHDTRLSLADVAFASGFGSVRRFNALFLARFGRAPLSIRRDVATPGADPVSGSVSLRLDFRAPYDAESLFEFLRARAIPGVEEVAEEGYRRTVRIGKSSGWIAVRRHENRDALVAQVSLSLASSLTEIAARLRALFDLDARPKEIARHLGRDRVLAASVKRRPGLRVPGSFDGFETAVRAVLGQQVTVVGATTLSGRLVARFGEPVKTPHAALSHTFPSAARIAAATEKYIAAIGLPRARAASLKAIAAAAASGAIRLEAGAEPESSIEALVALPGIGPWTAHYLAMRALAWPDAFPAGDLGIRKALGGGTPAAIDRRAEAWRPWRAYAALHLWSTLSKENDS